MAVPASPADDAHVDGRTIEHRDLTLVVVVPSELAYTRSKRRAIETTE